MVFCLELVLHQYGGRWLSSLRLAVVGGKACHKCLATSLHSLCLMSKRVDHQKRGLYGSLVGRHVGLFTCHLKFLPFCKR